MVPHPGYRSAFQMPNITIYFFLGHKMDIALPNFVYMELQAFLNYEKHL